jgi:hypothetical protein
VNAPTKVCAGPAHAQPTRLPLTADHWYYDRAGNPTRCKLCTSYRAVTKHDGPKGLVPARPLRRYAVELVERCGSATRVEELYGLDANTVLNLTRSSSASTQKRIAQRLLVALGEQRKLDRRNGTSPRFLAARKAQALHEGRLRELSGY